MQYCSDQKLNHSSKTWEGYIATCECKQSSSCIHVISSALSDVFKSKVRKSQIWMLSNIQRHYIRYIWRVFVKHHMRDTVLAGQCSLAGGIRLQSGLSSDIRLQTTMKLGSPFFDWTEYTTRGPQPVGTMNRPKARPAVLLECIRALAKGESRGYPPSLMKNVVCCGPRWPRALPTVLIPKKLTIVGSLLTKIGLFFLKLHRLLPTTPAWIPLLSASTRWAMFSIRRAFVRFENSSPDVLLPGLGRCRGSRPKIDAHRESEDIFALFFIKYTSFLLPRSVCGGFFVTWDYLFRVIRSAKNRLRKPQNPGFLEETFWNVDSSMPNWARNIFPVHVPQLKIVPFVNLRSLYTFFCVT